MQKRTNLVRITKIIQIKHDTVRGIESESFEQRRKLGKLKYSLTVRVYSKDKVEIHMRWSEPFGLPCNFIELSFVSKRNRERKSKP